MALVFSYVNILHGAIEPARTLWSERKAAALKMNRGGAAKEQSPAKVSPPESNNLLLAQLPSLDLNVLSNSLPKAPYGDGGLSNLTPSVGAGNAVLPAGGRALPKWLESIPASYASMREVYLPPDYKLSDPIVIHIQDAHENYEAQRNIARVIESLNRPEAGRTGVSGKDETGDQNHAPLIVGIEGARGDFNFKPYRTFPDREIARETAEAFLKDALITGPEYVGFTSERLPLFWGVEDPALYLKHVQVFKEAVLYEEKVMKALTQANQAIEILKTKIYSPALKELDDISRRHGKGDLGLGAYLKYLAKGESPSAPGEEMIRRFLEALRLEETMDFKQVEKERKELTESLAAKLPKQELKNLVTASLSYRIGNISYSAFYRYLQELCRAYGVDLARWPQMHNYIRYVFVSEKIKPEQLFEESRALEGKRLSALAKSPAERASMELAHDAALIEKLVGFGLSPEEWEIYRARQGEIAGLCRRINAMFVQTGTPLRNPAGSLNAPEFSALLSKFGGFNEAALARNESLVGNLLAKLKQEGTKAGEGKPQSQVAVLVAGGFHTRGVTQLLKEKGVAYAVLSPRLGKVEGSGNEYLDFFRRDKTPLEKLFTGERITLARVSGTNEPMGQTAPIVATLERGFAGTAIARFVLRQMQERGYSRELRKEITRAAQDWVGAMKEKGFRTIRRITVSEISPPAVSADGKEIRQFALSVEMEGDIDGEDKSVSLRLQVAPKGSRLEPAQGAVLLTEIDGHQIYCGSDAGLVQITRAKVLAVLRKGLSVLRQGWQKAGNILSNLDSLFASAARQRIASPAIQGAAAATPGAMPWLYRLVQKYFQPDLSEKDWIETVAPRAETGLLGILYLFSVFLLPPVLSLLGVDPVVVQSLRQSVLHPAYFYIGMNLLFGLAGHWNYYVQGADGAWMARNPGWKDVLNWRDWWVRLKLSAVSTAIHLPLLLSGLHGLLGVLGTWLAVNLHETYNRMAGKYGWTPLAGAPDNAKLERILRALSGQLEELRDQDGDPDANEAIARIGGLEGLAPPVAANVLVDLLVTGNSGKVAFVLGSALKDMAKEFSEPVVSGLVREGVKDETGFDRAIQVLDAIAITQVDAVVTAIVRILVVQAGRQEPNTRMFALLKRILRRAPQGMAPLLMEALPSDLRRSALAHALIKEAMEEAREPEMPGRLRERQGMEPSLGLWLKRVRRSDSNGSAAAETLLKRLWKFGIVSPSSLDEEQYSVLVAAVRGMPLEEMVSLPSAFPSDITFGIEVEFSRDRWICDASGSGFQPGDAGAFPLLVARRPKFLEDIANQLKKEGVTGWSVTSEPVPGLEDTDVAEVKSPVFLNTRAGWERFFSELSAVNAVIPAAVSFHIHLGQKGKSFRTPRMAKSLIHLTKLFEGFWWKIAGFGWAKMPLTSDSVSPYPASAVSAPTLEEASGHTRMINVSKKYPTMEFKILENTVQEWWELPREKKTIGNLMANLAWPFVFFQTATRRAEEITLEGIGAPVLIGNVASRKQICEFLNVVSDTEHPLVRALVLKQLTTPDSRSDWRRDSAALAREMYEVSAAYDGSPSKSVRAHVVSTDPLSVLDPVFLALVRALENAGWRRAARALDVFRNFFNVTLAPYLETYGFLDATAKLGLGPLVGIGSFGFVLAHTVFEAIFDRAPPGELLFKACRRFLWSFVLMSPYIFSFLHPGVIDSQTSFAIAAALHVVGSVSSFLRARRSSAPSRENVASDVLKVTSLEEYYGGVWRYEGRSKQLFFNGRALPYLGGNTNAVFQSPKPSEVIRIAREKSVKALVARDDLEVVVSHMSLGIFPEVRASGALGGAPFVIVEKIEGAPMVRYTKKTWESAHPLDERQIAQVKQVLGKLLDAGLFTYDFYPWNIMTGTTQNAPVEKTYLADFDFLTQVKNRRTLAKMYRWVILSWVRRLDHPLIVWLDEYIRATDPAAGGSVDWATIRIGFYGLIGNVYHALKHVALRDWPLMLALYFPQSAAWFSTLYQQFLFRKGLRRFFAYTNTGTRKVRVKVHGGSLRAVPDRSYKIQTLTPEMEAEVRSVVAGIIRERNLEAGEVGIGGGKIVPASSRTGLTWGFYPAREGRLLTDRDREEFMQLLAVLRGRLPERYTINRSARAYYIYPKGMDKSLARDDLLSQGKQLLFFGDSFRKKDHPMVQDIPEGSRYIPVSVNPDPADLPAGRGVHLGGGVKGTQEFLSRLIAESRLGASRLEALAKALGVTEDYFVGWSDKEIVLAFDLTGTLYVGDEHPALSEETAELLHEAAMLGFEVTFITGKNVDTCLRVLEPLVRTGPAWKFDPAVAVKRFESMRAAYKQTLGRHQAAVPPALLEFYLSVMTIADFLALTTSQRQKVLDYLTEQGGDLSHLVPVLERAAQDNKEESILLNKPGRSQYAFHGAIEKLLSILMEDEKFEALRKSDRGSGDLSQEGYQERLDAVVQLFSHIYRRVDWQFTGRHSWRVHDRGKMLLAELKRQGMTFAPGEEESILAGHFLHDIGKLLISRDVLHVNNGRKPSRMRVHPVTGAMILERLAGLRDVAQMVRYHHRGVDHTGYPNEEPLEGLPLGARIIAVADTVTAMLEHRPYQEPHSLEEVVDVLSQSKYDPRIAQAMMSLLRREQPRGEAGLWKALGLTDSPLLARLPQSVRIPLLETLLVVGVTFLVKLFMPQAPPETAQAFALFAAQLTLFSSLINIPILLALHFFTGIQQSDGKIKVYKGFVPFLSGLSDGRLQIETFVPVETVQESLSASLAATGKAGASLLAAPFLAAGGWLGVLLIPFGIAVGSALHGKMNRSEELPAKLGAGRKAFLSVWQRRISNWLKLPLLLTVLHAPQGVETGVPLWAQVLGENPGRFFNQAQEYAHEKMIETKVGIRSPFVRLLVRQKLNRLFNRIGIGREVDEEKLGSALRALKGKTIGLVGGTGNIGQGVSWRAKRLQMRVLINSPTIERALDKQSIAGEAGTETAGLEDPDIQVLNEVVRQGYVPLRLDQLLAQCEILSIQTPLSAETRGRMLTRGMLDRMKGVRLIVNPARTDIFDRETVEEALQRGIRVVEDARPNELSDEDARRLLQHNNYALTMHVGGSTAEARRNTARNLVRTLIMIQERTQSGRNADLRDIPLINSQPAVESKRPPEGWSRTSGTQNALRVLVLGGSDLSDLQQFAAELGHKTDVTFVEGDKEMKAPSELLRLFETGNYSGLILGGTKVLGGPDQILNRELFRELFNRGLRVIARAGVGYDNIAPVILEESWARGVPVINEPVANTDETAALTVQLIAAMGQYTFSDNIGFHLKRWSRAMGRLGRNVLQWVVRSGKEYGPPLAVRLIQRLRFRIERPLKGESYNRTFRYWSWTRMKWVVRKTGSGRGRDILIKQAELLLNPPPELRGILPKVIAHDLTSETVYYDMEFDRRLTLTQRLLAGEVGSDKALAHIRNILSVYRKRFVGTVRFSPTPKYGEALIKKIRNRLEIAAQVSPLLHQAIHADGIVINGKRYEMIPALLEQLEAHPGWLRQLDPPFFTRFHGNMHYDNVFVGEDPSDLPIFIDLRGDESGDPAYDMAQMLRSLAYDWIRYDLFSLHVQSPGESSDEFQVRLNFHDHHPAWKTYESLRRGVAPLIQNFYGERGPDDKDPHWAARTKFSELSYYLSASQVQASRGFEEKALAQYLIGLILLNEWIETLRMQTDSSRVLKLWHSPLPVNAGGELSGPTRDKDHGHLQSFGSAGLWKALGLTDSPLLARLPQSVRIPLLETLLVVGVTFLVKLFMPQAPPETAQAFALFAAQLTLFSSLINIPILLALHFFTGIQQSDGKILIYERFIPLMNRLGDRHLQPNDFLPVRNPWEALRISFAATAKAAASLVAVPFLAVGGWLAALAAPVSVVIGTALHAEANQIRRQLNKLGSLSRRDKAILAFSALAFLAFAGIIGKMFFFDQFFSHAAFSRAGLDFYAYFMPVRAYLQALVDPYSNSAVRTWIEGMHWGGQAASGHPNPAVDQWGLLTLEEGAAGFLSTPLTFLLTSPLVRIPYVVALNFWVALNAFWMIRFTYSFSGWVQEKLRGRKDRFLQILSVALFAFVFSPTIYTLVLGQINIPILLLIGAGIKAYMSSLAGQGMETSAENRSPFQRLLRLLKSPEFLGSFAIALGTHLKVIPGVFLGYFGVKAAIQAITWWKSGKLTFRNMMQSVEFRFLVLTSFWIVSIGTVVLLTVDPAIILSWLEKIPTLTSIEAVYSPPGVPSLSFYLHYLSQALPSGLDALFSKPLLWQAASLAGLSGIAFAVIKRVRSKASPLFGLAVLTALTPSIFGHWWSHYNILMVIPFLIAAFGLMNLKRPSKRAIGFGLLGTSYILMSYPLPNLAVKLILSIMSIVKFVPTVYDAASAHALTLSNLVMGYPSTLLLIAAILFAAYESVRQEQAAAPAQSADRLLSETQGLSERMNRERQEQPGDVKPEALPLFFNVTGRIERLEAEYQANMRESGSMDERANLLRQKKFLQVSALLITGEEITVETEARNIRLAKFFTGRELAELCEKLKNLNGAYEESVGRREVSPEVRSAGIRFVGASARANALGEKSLTMDDVRARFADEFPAYRVIREDADLLWEAGQKINDPIAIPVDGTAGHFTEDQLKELKASLMEYGRFSIVPPQVVLLAREGQNAERVEAMEKTIRRIVGEAAPALKRDELGGVEFRGTIKVSDAVQLNDRIVYDATASFLKQKSDKAALRVRWYHGGEIRMISQTAAGLVVVILNLLSEVTGAQFLPAVGDRIREIRLFELQA